MPRALPLFAFTAAILAGLIAASCAHPHAADKTGTNLTLGPNPIIGGWYADPEAAIFDNQAWIYPTTSAPYDQQTFLDAFSSSDLKHWTKHPRVLSTKDVQWARRAMWAPAIAHHNGHYFLFFAANDIQSDNDLGGIGIAIADKPEGPFHDYLGRPLIDKFHNGAQPIDQCVFQDKGQTYLIYGGWRHCNIAKLFATNDFITHGNFPSDIAAMS